MSELIDGLNLTIATLEESGFHESEETEAVGKAIEYIEKRESFEAKPKFTVRCIIPHTIRALEKPQMAIGPNLSIEEACKDLKIHYGEKTAEEFLRHVFLEAEYENVIRGIINNSLPFAKGHVVYSPSGGAHIVGPIKHISYPAHDYLVCQIMLHKVL